ncbi:hypothetical protein [Parasedimentitalea huanghaiensis]|uniref:Uncharacterized protein n=1 Tax=Parasedimentitalea huanghaiensis TaxID=2682100 RepID=A0A6L6WJX6_9RHOB|nr:hypothetical protein [Zongyanglinia huanghaiensis]MVO16865.1 hypothetical protein [Zongyanglinia huanghaiensis]
MSATEATSQRPSTGQILLAVCGGLGGIAALFGAGLTIESNKQATEERRQLVLQSGYNMEMENGVLRMDAQISALSPIYVVVTPVFDMPVDRLQEAYGEAPRAYEDPRPLVVNGRNVIMIKGVDKDICDIASNRPKCTEFGILEYKVEYSLDGGVRQDIVPPS